MMELNIEIETNDRTLTTDLFNSGTFVAGHTKKILSEGVSIRYEGGLIRKALGYPELVRIALEIGEKVGLPVIASLIAKWLYDKLKGLANSISIEYTKVEIIEDKIRIVIIEKMEKKSKSNQ